MSPRDPAHLEFTVRLRAPVVMEVVRDLTRTTILANKDHPRATARVSIHRTILAKAEAHLGATRQTAREAHIPTRPTAVKASRKPAIAASARKPHRRQARTTEKIRPSKRA